MYRVFLVDDEEITLNQIAETIPWIDNGFAVVGKESDPVRAVERILLEKPEVVFSDLKMPRMSGHELMRKVREGNLYPEFVMLSAYGNFEDARTFFKQEGYDYLLKPMRMSEVELLLENLSRRLAEKYPYSVVDIPDQIDNKNFEALVEYVKRNCTQHLTLEQLGKKFGLSGSYICALFTRYYNTSLTCFMTKLRMEMAREKIIDGSEPIKSIAHTCGYKDYYYFLKVFKGYYGISPLQYKKDGKDDEEDV